ncbi:MAG: Ig-like domain-containing protein [Candidatus Eisenbacteria bacterium]
MRQVMNVSAMIAWIVVLICAMPSAGVACPGTSIVWADHYSACPGDTVSIYVLVQDCYGVVLPGKIVHFYSSRGSYDTVIGSPDVTDANGIGRARITSMVVGGCQVYVNCQGIILGPSEAIVWSGASTTEHTTWGAIKAICR